MSHFSAVKTSITNQAALVRALTKLGFTVESHETAVPLNGWSGDSQGFNGNVIIRNKQLGTRADVAWVKNTDGTFSIIEDSYETHRDSLKFKGKSFPSIMASLPLTYGVEVVKMTAEEEGDEVEERVREDGSLVLRVIKGQKTVGVGGWK